MQIRPWRDWWAQRDCVWAGMGYGVVIGGIVGLICCVPTSPGGGRYDDYRDADVDAMSEYVGSTKSREPSWIGLGIWTGVGVLAGAGFGLSAAAEEVAMRREWRSSW